MPTLILDPLSESLTIRELIRSRVYQEVDEFNRRLRTGYKLKSPPLGGSAHSLPFAYSATSQPVFSQQ